MSNKHGIIWDAQDPKYPDGHYFPLESADHIRRSFRKAPYLTESGRTSLTITDDTGTHTLAGPALLDWARDQGQEE